MFRLQHQFNNSVETTQLNNDQIPEFHCHCKCSKCSPPAPSNNTSLQSPYLRNLLQTCRSVLVASCPRLPEAFPWVSRLFSALFKACKPPTLHPIRDSPLGLYSTNLEAIDLLWWYLDSAGPQPVLWAARRCVARCVCWRAVLLEDESGGQPAIAFKER